MRIKKLFTLVLSTLIALSASATTASADEIQTPSVTPSATEAPTPTVAADPYSGVGSYMAFFQIQTTTWVYRNNFDDAKTGYGSDIFKTVYNNETSAATSTVINDAVIDGDGDYTISLSNLSLEGSTDFYMVAISTNIPVGSGIKVTSASLKCGSKTITSSFVQKNDDKKYIHIMLINQYDNQMKDTVNTLVPADGTDMIINFTVAGFGYAKTIQDEATTASFSDAGLTPAVDPTVAPDSSAVPADTTTVSNNSAADKDNAGSSTPSTGIIIGAIAGVVIVAVIIGIIVSLRKKKQG